MPRFLVWATTAIAVTVFADQLATAASVVVGSCKPNLTSYNTISAAVSAVSPGSTVLVCPGTYPEQVVITQPLTLQGVVSGNAGRAVIVIPRNLNGAPNLQVNSSTGILPSTGVAGQVVIQNVTPPGPVNIAGITVDGSGANEPCVPDVVLFAIYFNQGTTGTVNHVTVRNELSGGCGTGVAVDHSAGGGPINIANSSVHDVDLGIVTYGPFDPSAPVTQVGGNFLAHTGDRGIWLITDNATAARNIITLAGRLGIEGQQDNYLIYGNTLADMPQGMQLDNNGTAQNNNIANTSMFGIFPIGGAAKFNTVMNSSAGIWFSPFCTAVNGAASQNYINDAAIGFSKTLSGFVPSDFANVDTISTGCP